MGRGVEEWRCGEAGAATWWRCDGKDWVRGMNPAQSRCECLSSIAATLYNLKARENKLEGFKLVEGYDMS